jgi:hypothetical protein
MKPIPASSADLITELDTDLAPRHPRLTDSERQIWFDAGQRALIDNLKLRLDKTMNSGKLLGVR